MHDQITIKSKTAHHFPALLILLAFIALCLIYSRATPPFEAGDESRHFAVVKYMAETGHLINQNAAGIQPLQHHWSHEGSQPPLYYALAAALTGWLETGSWDEVFWYNPHTTIGNPLRPDNKNITIHPPDESRQNYALAVQLGRLFSIALATVTVATSYAIALRLFRGNRWLAGGAMAITAFTPMFIFISASVNNDNAVIMFVTLALYQLTIPNEQLIQKGKPVRYAALLGLLIGLGALSKLYAFGLLPLAVLRLVWLAYSLDPQRSRLNTQHPTRNTQHGSRLFWRNVLLWNLLLIGVFIAVAGWFYARNAILYKGDVFALQVMRETAGQREQVPTLATLRAEFEGFRIAYWALFGGVNILADSWIYTALDVVSMIALIGLLSFILLTVYQLLITRSKPDLPASSFVTRHSSFVSFPTFSMLLAWSGIMIAGFIVWNLTQPAGQGRLLYPAIAAISSLGLLGLTWWLPPTGQKLVVALVTAGLFLFAAISPFRYIVPAYAPPPILTQAGLPAGLRPVDFSYDDGALRLIGYTTPAQTVRPAETLPITLYWQLLRPVEQDYSIFIHLLGRQRQNIGQIDSYPGGGKWPTSLLSPGDIIAGRYNVPISAQAEFEHAPARLQIAAGIYDYHEPGRPGKPAINAQGQPVEPIIGAVKLVPWQWPEPLQVNPPVNFFDKATLVGYNLNNEQLTMSKEQFTNSEPETQNLTLYWQVDDALETDYTVFIQAWDVDANQYVTGFDGPPVGGDYPTSMWAAGEIIVDPHPLDLSQLEPGLYTLRVGLYNPTTGERLPAFGPGGPLPDYALNIGPLQVTQ